MNLTKYIPLILIGGAILFVLYKKKKASAELPEFPDAAPGSLEWQEYWEAFEEYFERTF